MRRALVVLALVAASCSVVADDALVVGAVYPTDGGQGPGGIEEFRGVELAAELVNERGGVRGRPVRVELEETPSREAAPAAVERLAADGVQVVLGSYGSTISRAAANAASRLGLVFWETGAVGDLGMGAELGRNVFRVPAPGGVLGREAIAFVRDRLEPGPGTRYSVTYVDDVYGRAVARGALEEIERSGLELAAELPYDLANFDADELATEVAAASTDVLMVVAYLEDGVGIRRALVRHDVRLAANIGTSSSYCMRAFGAMLGPDAVGVFASDKASGDALDPSSLTPEVGEFLVWARETYEARFGEPMTAPALSGFSGAWALLTHVLPAADQTTAASVARAANQVRVPMGSLPDGGGLAFGEPGGPEAGTNLAASTVIWEWTAPGERTIVWPPALASPEPANP